MVRGVGCIIERYEKDQRRLKMANEDSELPVQREEGDYKYGVNRISI